MLVSRISHDYTLFVARELIKESIYIYIISYHGTINSMCKSFRPLLRTTFLSSFSFFTLSFSFSLFLFIVNRIVSGDALVSQILSLTLITLRSFRYVTRFPTRRIVVLTVS